MPSGEQQLIEETAGFVRETLAADSSGHDWWHVWRVWQTSLALARSEQADEFVVSLAAPLHDIADWKFHGGDDTVGPRRAADWLRSKDVAEPTIVKVCQVIDQLSFKGAGVATPMTSLEGQVVQDADRLDALGAIGIARAFAYGGHAGRPLYDPMVEPELHQSFEAYKKNKGPTINHFYEKLLLLKDRMNTESARAIAAERDAFMRRYLEQFFHEWNAQS